MTVGSLFTGIGGLDLGLERAGMRIVWQSEIDPYASRVLAKHWPTVPNLGDVTAVDWSTVDRPDLVCGGFPCQPFSTAGSRKGADDPRHLWPHFATCLRLVRPRWALLENVPGILTLGFGEVAADLAALGYDLEWECIPAAAVGAPHLRYRIFVVAHAGRVRARSPERRSDRNRETSAQLARRCSDVADTDQLRRERVVGEPLPQPRQLAAGPETGRRQSREQSEPDMADPDEQLRVRTGSVPAAPGTREGEEPERQRVRADIGDGGQTLADADGAGLGEQRQPVAVFAEHAAAERSSWWESEPDVGRVAHGIPARVDRLRCLGNAVVPQVAELVGHMILETAS